MKLFKHGNNSNNKCFNALNVSFLLNFTISYYPPYHSMITHISLTNKSITLNTTFQDVISHLPFLVHNSRGKHCSYNFHNKKGIRVPHPPLIKVGTCINTNISITSNTSKCWREYLQMFPYCHKITHAHTKF
jgi:hypothetical protein